MQQFAAVTTPLGSTVSLAMKAAVAVGPARRFLVGDPNIRVIDALAGRTLERLAAAEHMAERGEVLLDPVALDLLASRVVIESVRHDEEGVGYGVVAGLDGGVEDRPWPPLAPDALGDEQIRRWLLKPIYERLRRGMGEFLAELRPTVALFLRFGGIDFDEDEAAGETLDAYIQWIQSIVAKYEGTLIDLNIGDKGAYLYVNFGAPLSHEDNSARAAYAALELRETPPKLSAIDQVQIGISQGRMRAGAYGGAMHRTYGVLGDEVNMSARLMMKAAPGQILVSEAAQRGIIHEFEWEELPPMRVKGKTEPAVVFALKGVHDYMAGHLQQVRYALPMVGRGKELARLEELLERVLAGSGQLAAITGEAGVGKSRLATELFQMASERGVVGYSGACESYGVNTSYLVWHTIWRGLLEIDPTWDVEKLQWELEQKLGRIDPAFGRPRAAALFGAQHADPRQRVDEQLRRQAAQDVAGGVARGLSARRRPARTYLHPTGRLPVAGSALL
ncbi:MAG: AAA family ATPase [Caldilineaceae bacterium]|nr:AAA family ATPase [Caldilineaceae bacterium]